VSKIALVVAVLGSMAAVPAVALAMEPYLPKSPKVFSRLDSDSNGRITLAEIRLKAERRFEKMDGDRNGEVTLAEVDAVLNAALEKRKARIMAKLDADRNDVITKAELGAYVEALVNLADADHNGGVTIDEAQKFNVAKLKKPVTGESSN
jgi:Ca2+-binding EF-hand superfamily protein